MRAGSRLGRFSASALLLGYLGAAGGCASNPSQPRATQLQIREFQTRSFDTEDVMMVMKAVASVMQDDGYIIKEANSDLGLLTATKETDIDSTGGKLWRSLFFMYGATSQKTAVIEATGNVSSFGAETRVRMNFQLRVLDNKGGTKRTNRIEDGAFYQDFFAKLDKALFLQKEKVG